MFYEIFLMARPNVGRKGAGYAKYELATRKMRNAQNALIQIVCTFYIHIHTRHSKYPTAPTNPMQGGGGALGGGGHGVGWGERGIWFAWCEHSYIIYI